MNWRQANLEVDRLREKYPAAIFRMESDIGPIPLATPDVEQEVIDHVIYMIRVWCLEIYMGEE